MQKPFMQRERRSRYTASQQQGVAQCALRMPEETDRSVPMQTGQVERYVKRRATAKFRYALQERVARYNKSCFNKQVC